MAPTSSKHDALRTHDADEAVKRPTASRAAPVRDAVIDPATRRLKQWHLTQGDRLTYQQCKNVVVALQSCPGWETLLQNASDGTPPVGDTLSVGIARLKRFGYTSEAAETLIAVLISPGGA